MNVAGIDGAPGGWMVAEGSLDTSSSPEVTFQTSLDELFDAVGQSISHLVIDMPIGLSADGNRAADVQARSNLGSRRSTFFPTPVRAVLDADDFDAANAASRSASGRGLSIQAWNLVPKIREIDALHGPEHVLTVLEGHPESSFAAMAGAPVQTRKATAEGRTERIGLLQTHVSPEAADIVASGPKRIDAIDALALLWTARRAQAGTAVRLGDDVSDPVGRPMWLTI